MRGMTSLTIALRAGTHGLPRPTTSHVESSLTDPPYTSGKAS
jgi:hypothetical protein